MTVQNISIGATQPTYEPPAPPPANPTAVAMPELTPGETVVFALDLKQRTDTVTVTLTPSWPFEEKASDAKVNVFSLDGSSENTASRTLTVKSDASGKYQFTAVPVPENRPSIGGESPVQPGTVSGDLDVTPPQPPREPDTR
ncbi:hypothetical protein D187_001159 [Cystobacter fuscus DSM 2262]|uniref:Uncharacterized protein n=1 Tax=Cystobacter fuscus (strain ATCC 25194 / DSM 2262 / NBRC 100088 / M29) TaxID=1242864 RepID=S9PE80_CYSF2|nr:hypothetical protein [Cystobacter fuscus]EPX61376.1 hypothetical protein D187_001159 [Cystobacter fuscus DSM 2262]